MITIIAVGALGFVLGFVVSTIFTVSYYDDEIEAMRDVYERNPRYLINQKKCQKKKGTSNIQK